MLNVFKIVVTTFDREQNIEFLVGGIKEALDKFDDLCKALYRMANVMCVDCETGEVLADFNGYECDIW